MESRSFSLKPLVLVAALGCVGAIGFAGWSSRVSVPRPQDQETEQARWLGTIRHPELGEVSGLGVSNRYPEHFWMHNDSGHPAEVWLVSFKGDPVARCRLEGADNRDWEDLSTFKWKDRALILVADVGDNGASRETCQLYLLEEPAIDRADGKLLETSVSEVQRITFAYQDGPRNCEAAGVDPASGSVLLFEKLDGRAESTLKAGVYRLDIVASLNGMAADETPLQAERIGETPVRLVTALDCSVDGRRLAFRNYFQGFLLDRNEEQTWAETVQSVAAKPFQLPVEFQGEALALAPDAQSCFTASEFANQPVWQVKLSGPESPGK